jgi:hypothetical protein
VRSFFVAWIVNMVIQVCTTGRPPVPSSSEKGAIWEWLTRERRFGRSESD